MNVTRHYFWRELRHSSTSPWVLMTGLTASIAAGLQAILLGKWLQTFPLSPQPILDSLPLFLCLLVPAIAASKWMDRNGAKFASAHYYQPAFLPMVLVKGSAIWLFSLIFSSLFLSTCIFLVPENWLTDIDNLIAIGLFLMILAGAMSFFSLLIAYFLTPFKSWLIGMVFGLLFFMPAEYFLLGDANGLIVTKIMSVLAGMNLRVGYDEIATGSMPIGAMSFCFALMSSSILALYLCRNFAAFPIAKGAAR